MHRPSTPEIFAFIRLDSVEFIVCAEYPDDGQFVLDPHMARDKNQPEHITCPSSIVESASSSRLVSYRFSDECVQFILMIFFFFRFLCRAKIVLWFCRAVKLLFAPVVHRFVRCEPIEASDYDCTGINPRGSTETLFILLSSNSRFYTRRRDFFFLFRTLRKFTAE